MFTLSNQYNELVDLYKIMADDGYKRSDGAIVKKAYSDAEPHKFAEQLKVIIKYLNAKTALDYGSGGSDLNNTKLNNGKNFKEYIGLSKVYPFEPAREKKLKPEEIDGSTFTISNLGMFGIQEFTSIINQPNGAILSVGAIVKKPIVKDDKVVVGNTLKLTLACDHRVVDGATGAQFLQTLKDYIENPLKMLL